MDPFDRLRAVFEALTAGYVDRAVANANEFTWVQRRLLVAFLVAVMAGLKVWVIAGHVVAWLRPDRRF